MTITDHIEALDMTLEAADGSDTITLAYATVEELRDTLAWAQSRIELARMRKLILEGAQRERPR